MKVKKIGGDFRLFGKGREDSLELNKRDFRVLMTLQILFEKYRAITHKFFTKEGESSF